MLIRQATLEDAKSIAHYLLMAMEEIVYAFIGKPDATAAIDFLLHFVEQENNQYSYQNCLVVEHENSIIAAVNFYDGAKLHDLRSPIISYVRNHFNPHFNPEDETQSGEYYIDCLAVHPHYQGQGVATNLLQFLIQEYSINKKLTLGLLVEENNPSAKNLYFKLGFKRVGEKILVGKQLDHLQIKY
jgi:ribosomal protein S18 acetylase RimI-like enzyme